MSNEVTDIEVEELIEGEATTSETELEEAQATELGAWQDKIKAWLKKHPGKSLKDAIKALKADSEAEAGDWDDFDEQGIADYIAQLERDELKAPTMAAIVYAFKKAGASEDILKKGMAVLRQKYPSPYPEPAKAEAEPKVDNKDQVDKLSAENETLKAKVEQLSKPDRKSVKTNEQTETMSEDDVYAQIAEGIRGL